MNKEKLVQDFHAFNVDVVALIKQYHEDIPSHQIAGMLIALGTSISMSITEDELLSLFLIKEAVKKGMEHYEEKIKDKKDD